MTRWLACASVRVCCAVSAFKIWRGKADRSSFVIKLAGRIRAMHNLNHQRRGRRMPTSKCGAFDIKRDVKACEKARNRPVLRKLWQRKVNIVIVDALRGRPVYAGPVFRRVARDTVSSRPKPDRWRALSVTRYCDSDMSLLGRCSTRRVCSCWPFREARRREARNGENRLICNQNGRSSLRRRTLTNKEIRHADEAENSRRLACRALLPAIEKLPYKQRSAKK